MAKVDFKSVNRALLQYVAARACRHLELGPETSQGVRERVAAMSDQEVELSLAAWPR